MCPPQANAKVGDRERRTHGNAEQAHDQLNRRDNVEQRGGLGVGGDEPIEGAQRQAKGEEVLKDDHAGEALDGEVACAAVSIPQTLPKVKPL